MTASQPRHRKRYDLSLPTWVRFWQRRGGSSRSTRKMEVLEDTVMENISTEGCYFFLAQKPSVGASVEIEMLVPARASGAQSARLRCRGKVLRIEEAAEQGKVGVACAIEHHSLFPVTDPPPAGTVPR